MKKRFMRVGVIILGVCVATIAYLAGNQSRRPARSKENEFHSTLFGDKVFIFSPDDDPEVVQAILSSIYNRQEANQFGDERYAIYFLPGEYDARIAVQVGFYTQVAGLGLVPTDTSVESLNCLARWLGDDSNHNACCNFWRGVENLGVRSNTTWAVSQATDFRRMMVDGALYLHDDYGWCSGGYISDSYVTTLVDSGTQQQWLSRNSEWPLWMDDNWNMVFVGLAEGSAPQETWPTKQYTTVESTDVAREKPFLVYDKKQGYGVYVPAMQKDSTGTTWRQGVTAQWLKTEEEVDDTKDCILPISRFYIAKPGDTAVDINAAIASGKHVILTPGIYEVEEPIRVSGEGRIVLGMGLATIRNVGPHACMEVEDESGVIVAGILFDAGETDGDRPEYLVRIGDTEDKDEAKNCPITLADLYCRVGGTSTNRPCQVDTCVVIDADDVVCDNFWIWRADHGSQVAWDKNIADTGVIVNGDRVVAYGLMVEHFEKYQTVWNGNEGRIYMYQCEIPYDVPNESVWMSHDGTVRGYASIKVADDVTDFAGYGLGIYLYNRDAVARMQTAVEMPDITGVHITNICTVVLNGRPGMRHIINEAGGSVVNIGDREIIRYYEAGNYK